MQKVWDGSNWVTQNALKVWTGAAWNTNAKLKARTSISWLPTAVSDTDISQVVKWSIEAPTPPPPPPPVTHLVPDLNLKTTTELNTILDPLNFGYTIASYETTNTLANDDKVVIDSQIPPAGEALAEFSNVSVKLYNFVQPTTTVPNIGGLLKSAADAAILAANLKVGSPLETVETYDPALVGRVVPSTIYPQEGTIQDTDTNIVYDYYVQKAYATVPTDIVGFSEDLVFEKLQAVGLTTGTRTTFDTTDASLDGKVKSISPAGGTQAQVPSNVNYVVNEHTLAIVPNLNNVPAGDVSAVLGGADSPYLYPGVVYQFETTVVADENKVKVGSQSPAQNAIVAKGSSVNYTINVPNTTVAVPTNLVGMNMYTADALLENTYELNSTLGTVTYTTNSALYNTVKSYSPNSGTVSIWSNIVLDVYLQLPVYTPPNIVGLTPSTGPIDANFTWGSKTLSDTSTQTTTLFGKVATQSPATSPQVVGQAINYGIYVDGRPTVGSYVTGTASNATTDLNSRGLQANVVYANQAYNASGIYYAAGYVYAQQYASGTRLASGTSVTINAYNAYVPTAYTRTARVDISDSTESGYFDKNGNWNPSTNSAIRWTSQKAYKLTATTGPAVTTATNGILAGAYVGWQNSTNGNWASVFDFNKTNVNSFISTNITGGAAFTVGNVEVTINVGSTGTNGKTWYLDYVYGTPPTTLTQSGVPLVNTQYLSGGINNGDALNVTLNSTMKASIWDNDGTLIVHNKNTNAAATHYGIITNVQLSVNISWTEYQ